MNSLVILLALLLQAAAVDRSKFRTCQDTLFCRSHRAAGALQGQVKYSVESQSLQLDAVKGKLSCSISEDLSLTVQALQGGMVRLLVSESSTGRWKPNDLLRDEALLPAAITVLTTGSPSLPASVTGDAFSAFEFAGTDGASLVVVLHHSPLLLELYRGGILTTVVNGRSLLHYQKTQVKLEVGASVTDAASEDRHGGKEVVDYGEDGLAVYKDGTKEV